MPLQPEAGGKCPIVAHHKRKRPKHQRAGCLMCKPHKDERATKRAKPSIERQLQDERKVP